MLHVKYSCFWDQLCKTKAIAKIREQRICESDCVCTTFHGKTLFVYEHEHIAFPGTDEILEELKYNNQ